MGPNNQTFNVHESVLSKPPVLARMCSDGFQESVSSAIRLPEDEAEIFGFSHAGFMEGLEGLGLANKLADIYIMAEKYQIDDLKDIVIEMLSSIMSSTSSQHCFSDLRVRFMARCRIQILHSVNISAKTLFLR